MSDLRIGFAHRGDIISRERFYNDRCTNPQCERWLPGAEGPVVLCSLTMRYLVNFCSERCALKWIERRAWGSYSILKIGDRLP